MRTELTLVVAPLYPNRKGCLRPLDEAPGAVGSLPDTPVLFLATIPVSTTEVGLLHGTFSLGLTILEPKPKVVLGGPATVDTFEGRGLSTPCKLGLCATFCCAGICGSRGRAPAIDGRPAVIEELPPLLGTDDVRR